MPITTMQVTRYNAGDTRYLDVGTYAQSARGLFGNQQMITCIMKPQINLRKARPLHLLTHVPNKASKKQTYHDNVR